VEDYTLCPEEGDTLSSMGLISTYVFLELDFSLDNQHYHRCWMLAPHSHPGLCFAMMLGIVFLRVWMWQKQSPESVKISSWFEFRFLGWQAWLQSCNCSKSL